MDNIKNSLPDKLTLDTQTWGPRRFALVRLVDALAQDVYVAFAEADLTPRDAEGLLGHLGMAAWYLYMPGSQKRRLMSPTGGRRRYPSYKKSFPRRRRRRRHLQQQQQQYQEQLLHHNTPIYHPEELERALAISIPFCNAGSKKSGKSRRKGYMDDADEELEDFLDELDDLDDDDRIGSLSKATIEDWITRATAIQKALPDDINYSSNSRSSSS
jgi:hypothetical protein